MPDNKSIVSVENGGHHQTKLATKDDDQANGDGGNSGGSAVILPSAVLNKMYHSYSLKQRRSGLKWFLLASVLFDIWSLINPQEQCIEVRVVTLVVLCLNIVLYILMRYRGICTPADASKVLKETYNEFLNYAPYLIWIACVTQLIFYILLQSVISPRDVLGWAILLNFLIYVTFPIPLFLPGCTIGLATFGSYLGFVYLTAKRDALFPHQMLASGMLLLTAAIVGLLYYFMGEAKQKRAFLETKKSLEVKMMIEEQSAEQERLLLSVLPKHVAEKMRQDLGSKTSEPFKKIYMSRHENVSILYADIVGFTAISSTYSAQDLVKMLNELFARFDRLAEKYNQLRIKILGDCYYCISGAPDERPDHAVLCVHMGLSMVKAIKYVQQKTNSPVDMRVGIHTGAVLAGILGQRQWQFDVYSKDVELANKMESSGKAGRVHISDKTLAFLNGEFEVEPAHGERREEALRIAGLKTYFITRVLKPFASSAVKLSNEEENPNNEENIDKELTVNDNDNAIGVAAAGVGDEDNGKSSTLDKQGIFEARLQEELVARDGHENLSKDTTILLKFNNKTLEAAYSVYREPYSSVPLVAALIVQFIDILYSYVVLPRSSLHFVNISAPMAPMSMLVFISVAESFPHSIPDVIVNVSKRFNDITFVRELSAIIIGLTIGLSNLIDMYFFVAFLNTEHLVSEGEFNLPTESVQVSKVLNDSSIVDIQAPPTGTIMYPSFMSNFGVLILIAIAVIAQLTHVTKIILMATITVLHCYCNMFVLNDLYYAFEDSLAGNPAISKSVSASGILIVALLSLSCLARHMDREDRIIFKWKTEVAEQKERANDMRQRNEALVYNVLPVHVAEHFMKNTMRSHDDLYSQSYSEVGVLFASMPNFSDFYSEETVNNQGLECLRFLNEVISDFDALLELPKFQDIIKIKTIGSTYMAASGINIHHKPQVGDSDVVRWAHLASLVEFALELKDALQGINEQSFNHFVLKMGVNHGPITAGVIGARKPHYDIWGNTVNVASRMESTGKAGAIQVTEETCNILQKFGYTFQQRGLVSVKGKGELMTYYLQGKSENVASPQMTKLTAQIVEGDMSDNNRGNHTAPLDSKTIDESDIDTKIPLLDIGPNENFLDIRNCNGSEKDSLIN